MEGCRLLVRRPALGLLEGCMGCTHIALSARIELNRIELKVSKPVPQTLPCTG
jgi:hypothetical protein